MKTFKINIPEGHEIDQEKSTFEEIVFKKKEANLPTSVDEIEGRDWFISTIGKVDECFTFIDLEDCRNNVSTKERAEAFLALMQLVELRDAWNEGWKADYEDVNQPKFSIYLSGKGVSIIGTYSVQFVLQFETRGLAEKFLDQFRDLINKAKELL